MEFSDASLLIIAGGKSSRMGRDKRFLSYDGEGLLERLARRAAALPFAERCLCVEERTPALQDIAERYGLTLVEDGVQGRGPMEGLMRGLSKIEAGYALAVSCDMPFLELAELRPLLKAAEEGSCQAVLPRAASRWQPSIAGTSQRALPRPLRGGSASSASSSTLSRTLMWISRTRRCSSMSTPLPTGIWPAGAWPTNGAAARS